MISNTVALYLLVFCRIMGALFIIPIFADSIIPRSIRSILCGVIALIITPYIQQQHLTIEYANIVVVLLAGTKEFLIGVLLGYMMSLPFWMIENTGNIIDVQRGEQMGSLYNPSSKLQSSSIGLLISKGFMVYFISNKGLLLFFQVLCESFNVMSVTDLHAIFKIQYTTAIKFFTNYIYWTVVLALPVIFILFLIDISLSLISSFVPQLNVTVTAMPIKAVVAILMVILFIGVFYHVGIRQFPVTI
jgi:type III secretion protein T